MKLFWGVAIISIGLAMFLSACFRSDLPVYRVLVARSAPLWGVYVHRFFQLSGLAILVNGVVMIVRR